MIKASPLATAKMVVDEVIPQVIEAAVLTLAHATREELLTQKEYYVLIPVPKVLLGDAPDEAFSTQYMRMALGVPFEYWLKHSEIVDEDVLDKNGEVLFALANQDMRAIRFVFTVPRHLFEEEE